MNYSGNMPDWHQYNPPQAGRTSIPGAVAQNANTSQHIFIPGISPPALDGINLSTERHRTSKHQNEASYVAGRNYPVGTMAATSVHMTTPLSGCVGHYGPTSSRNSMMEGHLTGSSLIDPRMVNPVGSSINEDVASHRNGQMTFAPPSNHSNLTNSMTVNSTSGLHSGSIGSQNSSIGPMSPGRQASVPYGTCKAPCCNPDPNSLSYQHWDKFSHYSNVPASYRDNIRQSAYPIDNRRFLADMNLRKDCHDGKDMIETGSFPVDHRTGSSNSNSSSSSTSSSGRNFSEYNKYTRKESVVTRNYPPPPPQPTSNSLIHQNYPMQNYNFPNDYQKCPYSIKDYTRRGNNNSGATGGSMSSKNSAIIKYHQEQSVIVQQKYHQHSKQMQYQNGVTAPTPTNLLSNVPAPSGNVVTSPLQNSYFNSTQLPRDLSRDYSRDYHQSSQDQGVVSNRMAQGSTNSHVHGSFQKYHVYHHKLAMQRFSMENHLRAFLRIPGYQTHPKYQECLMRYRELLRVQQTVDYPSVIQESPKVSSPAANGPVAPINLQFDQNGVLINSSYIHPGTSYPSGIHSSGVNHSSMGNSCSEINGESSLAGNNRRVGGTNGNYETPSHYIDHRRDLDPTTISTLQDEHSERYFMPSKKNDRNGQYEAERLQGTSENLDSMSVEVDGNETRKSPEDRTASMATIDYKKSKDFADKPELDVRQFLANWDESEDEDGGTSTNIVNARDDSTLNEQGEPANSSIEVNLHCNDKEENGLEENSENPSSTRTESSQDNEETVTIDNSSRKSLNEREIITKNIQDMECIRAEEMDDIPTIHIVENLECGSEMEKIHTVFGSLANLSAISIESGEIVGRADNSEGGETIVLIEHEQSNICTNRNDEVVEGVIASIIESSTLPESVTSQESIQDNEDTEIMEKKDSSDNSEDSTMTTTTTTSTTMKTTTTTTTSVIPTTNTTTTSIISSSSSTSSYNSSFTNSVGSASSSSSKLHSNDATNLRKQNSFTSDESHNPDDISLPDLQTSECTPISTTLNTPIQSDNEESSEHVTDLTISTNPIEIIQNSPIISFTHSPIKIEPYEQLEAAARIVHRSDVRREHDSLDFDFDEEVASNENRQYNENCPATPESVVQELEDQARNSDAMRIEKNAREKEENSEKSVNTENYQDEKVERRENDFYRTTDPLVGMAQITPRSVTNETENLDNLNEESTNGCSEKNGNDENRRIELDTDGTPTNIEREEQDDFNRSEDLEKLCEMSLDGSCMIPLIPDDDCDEPRMPVSPMEENCLTKILNDTMPITDLDMLESSDNENIDKPEDDIWDEVRNMHDHFDGNSISMSIESNKGKKESTKKLRKIIERNKAITRMEKSLSTSPTKFEHHFDDRKNYDTSHDDVPCKTNNFNDISLEAERASSPLVMEEIVKRDYKNCKDKNFDSIKCTKTLAKEKFDESVNCEETRKREISCDERRINRDEKESLENLDDDVSNESHNSIDAKNYFTKHRDSNVEIQVANLNVKIHNDNELMRNDSTCSKKNQESVEGIEAIEIKINLSRGDRRSNKSLNEKFVDEETREETKKSVNSSLACLTGNNCCRRRRRSMPETNDDKSNDFDYHVAKKMSKSRNNVTSSNRRKIRRSMDDELLPINEERSRKVTAPSEELNYQKETTKTFNISWPREVNSEIINDSPSPSLLAKSKDDETTIKKKVSSIKHKIDSRGEKYTKESTCRLPSPSYNSSLENSSTLDFDNFDVAPNRHSSETDNEEKIDGYTARKSQLDERDRYRNMTNHGSTTSFFEDLASRDEFEINLNTVPIYTTKDGRITYSPNCNYTYRALIIEARQREQRYSGIGKFHYTRHPTRNNYREMTIRKNCYKRRGDEKKHRTSIIDGHPAKSKRSSTPTRRRPDERKHENRRTRETRVSAEMLEKYCTDDQTPRAYMEHETRSVSIASSSLNSEKLSMKNFTIARKSEDTSNRDVDSSLRNFTSNKENENDETVIEDSLRSPKNFGIGSRETDMCLVSKIFQGQELEISSRNVTNIAACPDRRNAKDENEDCGENSRFFQDNSHLINKTTMASPMTMINTMEKRQMGGWDLDCQTALSDSGLESSTTYIEASKESRKIQRWRNSSFIESKLESMKSIYSIGGRSGYVDGNDDLSPERSSFSNEIKQDQAKDNIIENETLRYFDDETNILKIASSETAIAIEREFSEIDEPKKSVIVKLAADETKMEKIPVTMKKLTTTKKLPDLENGQMSEIVKSLDLAITSRSFEETRKKKQKDEIEMPRILENLNKASKILNGSFRRVSSDGVNSEENRRSFFQTPTLPECSEAQSLDIREDFIDEEEPKDPIELENMNDRTTITTTMSEELAENSLTRENFHQSCKDFFNDSSTSFSNCMKMRVPEPVSELPTESEASRLEDTSTRFASESMDFKEFGENENFASFSGQPMIIDNDTNGRDSLFASIAENAMNASNESDHSKESTNSGKAPILSFSGQIQNDRRLVESPSKSPPDLTSEDSIPKLVIRKNGTPSKAPTLLLDEKFELPILENETTREHSEHEIISHPKIPKMIIRNVKSRPGSPTAIEENEPETMKNFILCDQPQIFKVEEKLEKNENTRGETVECKIPKMKIKLEDRQLPRIRENARGIKMEESSRVRIKKVRKSSSSNSPVRADKLPLVGKLSRKSSENETGQDLMESKENSNASSSYKFTLMEKSTARYHHHHHHHHHHHQSSKEKNVEDTKQDKIPKLTIKKQDVPATSNSTYSSSQSINKKRRSRSPGELASKKQRRVTSKLGGNNKKEETRSRERRRNSLDSNEGNTDSHQSLSEKIPKVIIKRTSPSAEFKCELSKDDREAITKDSKWQPEVKLQRSWVLDCMAKEPGNSQVALKVLESTMEHIDWETIDMTKRRSRKWKRSSSDSIIRNSSPIYESKIRRKSDCEDRSRIFSNFTKRRKSLNETIEFSESSYNFQSLPASSINESSRINSSLEMMNFPFSASRLEIPSGKLENCDNEKKETKNKSEKVNDDASRKSVKKPGNGFDEPVNSVIKLDSSDESQTTIEILLASPDNSQPELDMSNQSFQVEQECIGNCSMGKIYSDDAIPTQFELELEIVDNSTIDSLDVPLPAHESSHDDDSITNVNIQRVQNLDCHRCSEKEEVCDGEESKRIFYEKDQTSMIEANMKNVCCSDSLVKEVLAAKETLKRCLTKSKNVIRPKPKPRPKTAAEKKQGSSYDFVDLPDFSKSRKFDDEENCVKSLRRSKQSSCSGDRKKSVIVPSKGGESRLEKFNLTGENSKCSWINEKLQECTTANASKCSISSSTNSGTTKNDKSMEKESLGENSRRTSTSTERRNEKISTVRGNSKSTEKTMERIGSSNNDSRDDSINRKSYKIPKISRSREKNCKSGEGNVDEEKRKSPSPVKMPILEPQIDMKFELVGSDRDTSRSPPVITKQEEPEIDDEAPKKLEERVNSKKLDNITKQRDTEAVTFANIVSQLAYHEKATIRHRRYCTLCERWFPTAARHRRHLTGYQHRHTELTQRRTVHALFMLFTGKPCPRLLPASIVRTDCLPGEPTPLQIAVQDVAISLEDGACVKPNKDVSEKDE